MSNLSRNDTNAHDAQVIAGIEKHLQNVSTLPLAASTYTPADLVKLVQSRIDSSGEVASANANWHSKVAADQALSAKLTPILRGLRQYVLSVFGEASPVLADFGFTAPKRATLTPEEKVAAAAKAKATRKARNTMGKNQKKNVKGTVSTTAASTPSTASQPSAPGAAPRTS
jgi:hypothetical protein